MKKLAPFRLNLDDRESFGQKQVCSTCGTNLNVSPQEKKFQWAPRWISYLVFVSPLIYIIVYYIKAKKAKFSIPRCENCVKQEKTYTIVGLICIFGGLALMFFSLISLNIPDLEFLFALGMLVFFVALIVGLVLLVKIAIRIDDIDDNDTITFMFKEEVVEKLNN